MVGSGLNLRFIGPLRVLVDGAHVPVGRAQTRALLALLALRPGRPMSHGALAEALWPGRSTPVNPDRTVRVIVSRAREAVGEQLQIRGSSYVLDIPPDHVDLHRFQERAARAVTPAEIADALAEWTGTPFDDCGKVPRLLDEADRLHDLRVELVERAVRALLRDGNPAAAADLAGPIVDDLPLADGLVALHAVALDRAGRGREADLVLTRTAQLLVEVDPQADLDHLDAARRRIDAERRSRSTAPATPADRPATDDAASGGDGPGPLAGHVTDLVGRAGELAELRTAAAGSATRGRTVLIIGEPGIGKTALAASFAAELGWRQLCVRCGDGSPETLVDLAGSGFTTTSGGTASDVAATVSRAVRDALDRQARREPVVVVIDDLQWASDVDLRALRGLVRRGVPDHVLLLITVRSLSTLTADASRIVADLVREPTASRIELDTLPLEAVRELVRRIRPRTTIRTINRVYELTRGNAFAVRSLVEADGFDLDQGAIDAPAAVVLVTEQRLQGLDPDTVAVLEYASLIDPPIEIGALAALAGDDPVVVARLLDPAFERHLLIEERTGDVRFDHELTRQAVVQRLNPMVRRTLHDRLARHFAADRRRIVVAGRHLAEALPDSSFPDQVPLLLSAGEEALATQQFRSAVVCFEAAERLLPDGAQRRSTSLRRGLALENSGRRQEATELYDRLAADALDDGDRYHLAHAALAGLAEGVVGGDEHRLDRLRLAAEHPVGEARLDLDVLIQLATELGYADEAIPDAVVDRARLLASDEPGDQALLATLDTQLLPARPITAASFATIDRLAQLAAEGGDSRLGLRALELRTAALFAAGDIAAAGRSTAQLEARLRRTPAPRQRWAAALVTTLLADFEHGLPAAERLAVDAMNLGRDLELPDAVNAFAIFRLSVAVRSGGLEALEPALRAAANGPRSVPAWHAAHAIALRVLGRPDEAVARLERFRAGYQPGHTRFADLGMALTIATTAGLPGADGLRAWAEDALRPWSGTLIVLGSGAGCFGPSDLYLDLAAAADPADAASWAGRWLSDPWLGLARRLSAVAGSSPGG